MGALLFEPLEYPHTRRVRVACLGVFSDLCQSVKKQVFRQTVKQAIRMDSLLAFFIGICYDEKYVGKGALL